MQKFSSFGRKKNRPKFDIEWLCSKVFIYFYWYCTGSSMCHMIPRICRSLVLSPKRKMFLDAVCLKQVIKYVSCVQ